MNILFLVGNYFLKDMVLLDIALDDTRFLSSRDSLDNYLHFYKAALLWSQKIWDSNFRIILLNTYELELSDENLGGYVHTHILICHVESNSLDTILFCSRTWRNLHHSKNCEVAKPEFHLHSEQKSNTLYTRNFVTSKESMNKISFCNLKDGRAAQLYYVTE